MVIYFKKDNNFVLLLNLKILDKFNKVQAKEILEWISEMIGEEFDTSGEIKNTHSQLKDGQKLCK